MSLPVQPSLLTALRRLAKVRNLEPPLLEWGQGPDDLPAELWPLAKIGDRLLTFRIATPEQPAAEPKVLWFSWTDGASWCAPTLSHAVAEIWGSDIAEELIDEPSEPSHEVPRGYERLETADRVGIVVPKDSEHGARLVELRDQWWAAVTAGNSDEAQDLRQQMAAPYTALGRADAARRMTTGRLLKSAAEALASGDLDGVETALTAGETASKELAQALANLDWPSRHAALPVLEAYGIPIASDELALAAQTAGRVRELGIWMARGHRPRRPTPAELMAIDVEAAVGIVGLTGARESIQALAGVAVLAGKPWALSRALELGAKPEDRWMATVATHPEPVRSNLMAALRKAGMDDGEAATPPTRGPLLPVLIQTGVVEFEGEPAPALIAEIDRIAAGGEEAAGALMDALVACDQVAEVFISDEGLAKALAHWASL